MENSQANFSNSFSTDQQHVDDARQRAGIADAAAQLADLGPQVLAIQQALLAGIARSQLREAKRLAERHAQDDPRILQAQARAEQVKALHEEARRQGIVLTRMIETVQDDNLFHGYIHFGNGPAAVDFKVTLAVAGPNGEMLPGGEASSDATGYFRIDLARRSSTATPPRAASSHPGSTTSHACSRLISMGKLHRPQPIASQLAAVSSQQMSHAHVCRCSAVAVNWFWRILCRPASGPPHPSSATT